METFRRQVKVLFDSVDYALVGLMQEEVVDVLQLHAGFLHHVAYVALGRGHRHAEHFAPFELHGNMGVNALASLEWGGFARQTVVYDIGHGRGCQLAGQIVVASAKHQCSGAVAEEHAGLALCPVDHACHLFRAYI